MQYAMRRRDRQVSLPDEIEEIMKKCRVCRLGLFDEAGPYIVPLNFAFVPGSPDRFYFHGAKEGRKAARIAARPKVGFELDCSYALVEGTSGCSYSCRYQSVIGTGRIGEVTDMEEKKQALAAIMAHYEPEKSFVFTDEQAQHVAVFRLDVAELTCKERS